MFFFFKQNTAYEMRISDWSSDVCSSDLNHGRCRWGHRLSDPATAARAGPLRHRLLPSAPGFFHQIQSRNQLGTGANPMSIQNRYDFVLLFDVIDGNPNGDPDAGNLPRVDAETGHGLVTDVCLKRKVRNYVGLVKSEQPPYEIYVKEKAVLNKQHERAYEGIGAGDLLKGDDKKRKGGDKVGEAREWMCKNFFAVRTFGAVMSTGVNRLEEHQF